MNSWGDPSGDAHACPLGALRWREVRVRLMGARVLHKRRLSIAAVRLMCVLVCVQAVCGALSAAAQDVEPSGAGGLAAPSEPEPSALPPGAPASGAAPSEPEADEGQDSLSAASRAASVNPTAAGLSFSLPVFFSQSVNTRGLRRDSQLTYDPTYTWTLSVRPRWNVSERLSLGARQDLTLELTESNLTSRRRQVWVDDTRFDASYTMRARPLGVSLTWMAMLRLPTSLVSIGARRSVNLGGGVLAIRSVDVLGGLVFYGLLSYRAWLSGSNVIRVRGGDEAFACDLSGVGSTSACEQAGGFTTTIGTLSMIGQVSLIPRERWTLSLALVAEVHHAHRVGEACVDVLSSPEPVCLAGDRSRDHIRTLTQFSLSLGYDIRDYLTLSLSYEALAYHPDLDGARDRVLFNELSTLSLTLAFRVGGYIASRRQ